MNRNFKLFALFLFFAAALVGCGGSPATTQSIDMNDAGQDQTKPDSADSPEAGMDADAAGDVTPDSQPDAGNDSGSEQDAQTCTMTACDPCSPDGQTCGSWMCLMGFWVDQNEVDSGISHEPCAPHEDAGQDTGTDVDQPDADAGNDASDATEADPPDGGDADVQVQPDVDAGAEAEADAPTQDADAGQDAVGYDAPPPPPEICNNGIDDDMNGLKDCSDPACANAPNCQPEVCDGLDNNQDGIVDNGPGMECSKGSSQSCTVNGKHGTKYCQDGTCKFGPCQLIPEVCNDGVDNDLDGKTDCVDPLCASAQNCQCVNAVPGDPCQNIGQYSCNDTWRCTCGNTWGTPSGNYYWCLQPEICNNGIDDDGDGYKDCKDSDCYGNPVCQEVCNDGVDNDGDQLVDCVDPDCANAPSCQPEVCDGLDNNGDGIVDNGTGMQCAGTPNNIQPCKTACNSDSWQSCNTATCQWNACQKPATETRCNDGQDDDCDGYVDCADPDCWSTTACPHTMPTCSAPSAGDGMTCTSWVKETVNVTDVNHSLDCCANQGGEQFCLVGNAGDAKLIRRTTNADWSEVALPVPASAVGGGHVLCLGTGQVYMVYNQSVGTGGVFAKWNGSSVVQLATGQVTGKVGPIFGKATTDIRFVAYDGMWSNAKIVRWNGSSLTNLPLPSFAPLRVLGSKMWGWSMQDLYLVGNLADDVNPNSSQGMLLHYDGTSWIRLQTPTTVANYDAIVGTSACDVLATGYLRAGSGTQGVTMRRNGTSWETKVYANTIDIGSVVMTQPSKYMLSAFQLYSGFIDWGWYGTSNADGSIAWEPVDQDPLNFSGSYDSWIVPGTNTMMMAGPGTGGIWILHATCQ